MGDPIRGFYDDLAESYHLIFQDWDRSIAWQAGVLGSLVERECGTGALKVLDCACGIGTQSLGLAGRGHRVTGVDLSDGAIARARREARLRDLAVEFAVADMRELSSLPTDFDVAMAADNVLPHLLDDSDLLSALRHVAGRLRPNGLFVATIRDYDAIVEERPSTLPPTLLQDGTRRRIYHQVWDWTGARQYTVHLYLTLETDTGWNCRHFVSLYRALLREELSVSLREAGFRDVRWLMPAESGFYQPIVLARKPGPH